MSHEKDDVADLVHLYVAELVHELMRQYWLAKPWLIAPSDVAKKSAGSQVNGTVQYS
jgi:hypothetical protein